MKQYWPIGLSILVALLLGGILVGCQQEVSPQVAGGYGADRLYTDDEWQLWVDVRSMEANNDVDIGDVTVNNVAGGGAVNVQDGGNVISVDDGGGALTTVAFDDAVASDGNSNTAAWALIDETNYRAVLIKNEIFNDTTWDRERNNIEAILLASVAYTDNATSEDQINYNGARLLVTVDVSALGAGAVITPALQLKDNISDNYFTYWTVAAGLSATGTYGYYFADGASGGSFTEIGAFGLPARTWRIVVYHNSANTITYSVGSAVSIH